MVWKGKPVALLEPKKAIQVAGAEFRFPKKSHHDFLVATWKSALAGTWQKSSEMGKWIIYKFHLGVSKNNGTPTWMVYNGKPY